MVNKGIWQRVGGVTEVAIKTLREGATEEDKVRFLQEAATSGQFQHPNVVKLQGVVTVGEPVRLSIVMISCSTVNVMFEDHDNTMSVVVFADYDNSRAPTQWRSEGLPYQATTCVCFMH